MLFYYLLTSALYNKRLLNISHDEHFSLKLELDIEIMLNKKNTVFPVYDNVNQPISGIILVPLDL